MAEEAGGIEGRDFSSGRSRSLMAAAATATPCAPAQTDRLASAESFSDGQLNSVHFENAMQQHVSVNDDITETSTFPMDPSTINASQDLQVQINSSECSGEQCPVYHHSVYSPQFMQTFFYGGFENPTNKWEDYSHYANNEGSDVGSADPLLMFHTGYNYTPQIPYGPYSPIATPAPAVTGDGQFYPQYFPFSAPYYQQPSNHSAPFISSPVPAHADPLLAVDRQGALLSETFNSSGFAFGTGPDWSRSSGGAGSMNVPQLPEASRELGASHSYVQGMPLATGMGSQLQGPIYGLGSSNSSFSGGYAHGGTFPHATNYGFSGFTVNGRNAISTEKGRQSRKSGAALCSCNGTLDFLNEQNRGPRTMRPKKQDQKLGMPLEKKNDSRPSAGADLIVYNSSEFVIDYNLAKFFIIKSYSEDNVHKSIKYGVWASTANGNKKLDAAYREATGREEPYPVFLFFSVNASSQFCGLAEMIGPVDFEKSVAYWQQDKWTGQFPVKWHIIKDVPNNLLRHIILENNDNKPVTNSRDTQQVELEQGLEMLSIFKSHEADASILDDFDFYEEREKAMLENRALQQQLQMQPLSFTANESQRPMLACADPDGDQITSTFAHVLQLDKSTGADAPKS